MINSINSDNAATLGTYMQKKYKKYLNTNSINEILLKEGKINKKLAFKYFIALYFPGLLDFLVKKKFIKSPDIF